MKNNYPLLIVAFLMSTTVIQAQSGLFIDTSYTAEQMVMDFFDNSAVTPSNITFNGAPASIAYFEAANTDLGIPAGIVISTGKVTDLPNPASYFSSAPFDSAGDTDLEALVGGMTSYDASVLEFDITASEADLAFTYLFGSEEYPEYVGSPFNDVFAFFISGPGITGLTNIAMVPGSPDAVAINNVNAETNSAYYVAYADQNGADISFDGVTTLLPAEFTATPGETYHIKIAVTDMADAIFDSGVLIGIGSLGGSDTLQPPAEFMAAVDGNTVTFDNFSRYATSWHWDFGDGSFSTERYPAPHTYAADGVYTVTLTTENFCCTDTYTIEVQIGEVNNQVEAQAVPFTFFPNPASAFLELRSPNAENLDYYLFDTAGKMLQAGTFHTSIQLNLANYTPGLYSIQVVAGEQVRVERFMIK